MSQFPYIYALFGLIAGSFLNVCIYRIPRGESIVFPGSHCPSCGRHIRPFDNVPVLSYLLLLGKCRHCHKPISPQYPLVELLTCFSFFFCASRWDATAPAFLNSGFLAVVTILVFVDFHHQILPNVITLPGIAAGILLSPLQDQALYGDTLTFSLASLLSPGNPDVLIPWAGSIFGAAVSAGVLLLVDFAYRVARKRQGLGMGDVKMMAMVGAFLGWRLALLTIFAGSFLGSIVGLVLIFFHGKSLQTKLPFGTFLGAGAALALSYGLVFISWYTQRP